MCDDRQTCRCNYRFNGIVQGIYFGEIRLSDNRALFVTFAVLTEEVGSKLELVISEFISFKDFTLIPFTVSIIAFITSFFMKESPHHLLMRNKREQACKNFAWLNGKSEEESRAETEELVRYIEEEGIANGFWAFVLQTANHNSCLMVIVTFVLAHTHCGMILGIYGIVVLKQFSYIISDKTFLLVYGLLHIALCS